MRKPEDMCAVNHQTLIRFFLLEVASTVTFRCFNENAPDFKRTQLNWIIMLKKMILIQSYFWRALKAIYV